MTFEVSHWSGRLGNNVQQVANCIMAAEKYQSTFMQKLDHDIISNYTVDFSTKSTAPMRYFKRHGAITSSF